MRPRAPFLLLLTLVTGSFADVTVKSVTTDTVTLELGDNYTVGGDQYGPGKISLNLSCGQNFFPVANNELMNTYMLNVSDLEAKRTVQVTSLCPIRSFSAKVAWIQAPNENIEPVETWKDVIEETRVGLVVTVVYDECSDGKDFCDGDKPWYQLKNKEFRAAANSFDCQGGSIVPIEIILTNELLPFYPVTGTVCLRTLTLPVWEVIKETEETMPLLDDLSFTLIHTNYYFLRPTNSSGRIGAKEIGDLTVSGSKRVKRQDPETTTAPYTICGDSTTVAPTTTALSTSTATSTFSISECCETVYESSTTLSTSTTEQSSSSTGTPSTESTAKSTSSPTTIATIETDITSSLSASASTSVTASTSSTSLSTESTSSSSPSTSTPTSTSPSSTASTSGSSSSSSTQSTASTSTLSTTTKAVWSQCSLLYPTTSTPPPPTTMTTTPSTTMSTTAIPPEWVLCSFSTTTVSTTTPSTTSTMTTSPPSTSSSTSPTTVTTPSAASTSTTSHSTASTSTTSPSISPSTSTTSPSTFTTSSSTTSSTSPSTTTPCAPYETCQGVHSSTTAESTTSTSIPSTASTSPSSSTSSSTNPSTSPSSSSSRIESTSPSSSSSPATGSTSPSSGSTDPSAFTFPRSAPSIGSSASTVSGPTGQGTGSTVSEPTGDSTGSTSPVAGSGPTDPSGDTGPTVSGGAGSSSPTGSDGWSESAAPGATGNTVSKGSNGQTGVTDSSGNPVTGSDTQSTLGTNIDCFITSSSLNISTIQSAPSQVALPNDIYVEATLQNTGQCEVLTWTVDGTSSDGGRIKREALTEGDHTICYSLGTQQLGCGYIEVVASTLWTNTCEDMNVTVHLNESLILQTPLPPASANANYQWVCTRSDSADCYTAAGKFMTMQGVVQMNPVTTILTGLGQYGIIANVTDSTTGQWSCRRYSVSVIDWTVTTTNPIGPTVSSDSFDSSSDQSDATVEPSDSTGGSQVTGVSSGPTTTLGQNVDCQTTSSTLNISTIEGAPTEITTTVAVITASLQSSGTCARLSWTIDSGTAFDAGTSIQETLTVGEHKICHFDGSNLLGCGYLRVLATVAFTNTCEDAATTVHVNETLVMETPAVPSESVSFNWQCTKEGAANNCYTTAGGFLTMQNKVSMTPVASFMNGVGVYDLVANATDSVTGQWSCRKFKVTVVDWSVSTSPGPTVSGLPGATDGSSGQTGASQGRESTESHGGGTGTQDGTDSSTGPGSGQGYSTGGSGQTRFTGSGQTGTPPSSQPEDGSSGSTVAGGGTDSSEVAGSGTGHTVLDGSGSATESTAASGDSTGTGSDGQGTGSTVSPGGGQGSTGTTQPAPTEIPATISPELQAKIDAITNIISQIESPDAVKEQCAQNTSQLAVQYSNMTNSELKAVAQGATDGTLVSGQANMTGQDVVEAITKSMDCVNSQLAQTMQGVLSSLSNITIDSPETLNEILKTLMGALNTSLTSVLTSSGANGEQTVQGTFVVLYGTIETGKYSLVTARSTVRIIGSVAYISGDIRPAKIQSDTTTLEIGSADSIGVSGMFGGTDLGVTKSPAIVRLLNGERMYARMNDKALVMSGDDGPTGMNLLIWNITEDALGASQQSQVNTAATFWVEVQSGSVQMDGSQATTMVSMSTTSIILTLLYNGITYTISGSFGTAQVIENRETECILQYDAAKISVSPTGSDLDAVQLPITLESENIACSSLSSSRLTSPAVSLQTGNSSHPMALVVPYTDIYEPPILATSSILTNIVLPFGEAGTANQMSQRLEQGLPVLITGTVSTTTSNVTFSSPDTVQFTGSYLIFLYGSSKSKLTLTSPTWTTTTIDGKVSLVISKCQFQNPTDAHTVTQVEVSTSATIYLTGGTIIRNGSHSYVISNAAINHTGILPAGAVDLQAQSLLNQDAQNLVMGILKDTASYLRANGSQMTMGELNETASNLLTMSGQIIENIISSLANPLSADLLKNLQYAKDNYNSLYNVLPNDPGEIIYVEEYTEAEWAQAATLLVQQQIARQMAAQLKDTMAALGDAFAAKLMSQVPYSISIAAGGGTLVEAGGNETSLLSAQYLCNDWTIVFPPKLTDLNVVKLGPSDLFRVSMFCFEQNPYAYSNNYASLVTSGILELALKLPEGEEIPVVNASKPVILTTKSSEVVDYGTGMDPSDFTEIQVLNIKTFHTTAWNYSIILELTTDDVSDLPTGSELWAYVSFQGLPGPMPNDHDFCFELSLDKSLNQFFVDGRELKNSSGLYYVGLGTRLPTGNANTVNYTIDGEQWFFTRNYLFGYNIRILTKGCYSFNTPTDLFDSSYITVPFKAGDQYIQCNTQHLTAFSIGLMSPEFDLGFSYQYIMDVKPLALGGFLLFGTIMIYFGICGIIGGYISDRDASQGRIRHLKDNRRGDRYVFVVTVETGHNMYATTGSKISFNLSGTEAQTITRSFDSIEDKCWEKPFQWGRTSRFLMTTRWPLGDLKYLRIWIEEPGIDHLESWYCSRILIKDLQTNQRYCFPMKNWLGMNASDGKTERLAEAVPKRTGFVAALNCQLFCETISYIAMWTAGGGMIRLRVSRDVLISNLLAFWVVAMWANAEVLSRMVYTNQPMKMFGYQCEWLDLAYGVGTALFITACGSVVPWVMRAIVSLRELTVVDRYKKSNTTFKIPKPDRRSLVCLWIIILMSILILLGSALILRILTRMPEDNTFAFTRRIIITLVLYILVMEPLKAFLQSWFIVSCHPDHNIIFPTEQAMLPIDPIESFQKATPGLRDDQTGTTYADLCQLSTTRKAITREDRLFHTMKEVLLLLAAMVIFFGLSMSSRDASGFYYQTQLRTQFNVDPPSKDLPFDRTLSFLEIKNSEDFWNWTNDSLAPNLLATWYDGQPAWDMRGFMNDKVSRAMGNGIIRQIRSTDTTCEERVGIPFFQDCLYDINQKEVSTGSYGSHWSNPDNGTVDEYSYRTGADLQNVDLEGEFFGYAGGGYTIILGGATTSFQKQLAQLKAQGWMDKYTRAVVVEFSVYNAQINYFAVIQLLLETPRGRIFLPTTWIEPLRLIKYEGNTGTATMIFEFLYIVYALILFVKEFVYYFYRRYRKMKKDRFPRNPLFWPWHILFSDLTFWDLLNFLTGILAAGSIATFILRNVYVNIVLDTFTANNGNAYINLSTQRTVEMTFTVCYAGVVFFISCKMIKILRFNRRIAILTDTLNAASEDVTNFGFSFLLTCGAFNAALFGLLWYELEGYRTAMATCQTTIAAMLGKFVITDLYGISTLASIFFIAYLLTGTIILLNIYVMIIMTWFEEVRNDPAHQANDYELLDHLQNKLKRQLGLLGREDRPALAAHDTEFECPGMKEYLAKTYLTEHNVLMMQQKPDPLRYTRGRVFMGCSAPKSFPRDC